MESRTGRATGAGGADTSDRPLVILHVEDDPWDAQLIQREIDAALPGSEWHLVITEAQYREAIQRTTPDLILADYNLPDFNGLTALAIARECRPQTPFIFVSGALGEEVAIETLKSGATDYVLKDRLQRLLPAVRRALAEAHDREERRRLEEELSEISNREQRRIGSDLHDGLGQELTGLSLILRSIETTAERCAPQMVGDVARSRQVLAQAIESTRRLARGLAPVNLERGGLPAALEHLSRQYSGTELQCNYEGELQLETPLEESAATHLYRIAQEAVSNAAKHAQAHAITIGLTAEDDTLLLKIADDGTGIPQALLDKPTGMGVRLMNYRARMIGAEIMVESSPGGGTVIACRYCPPPHPSADEPLTVRSQGSTGKPQRRRS